MPDDPTPPLDPLIAQRRQREKAERAAYRDAAQRFIGTLAHVTTLAPVVVHEDGAFVEATIWVPKELIR